MKSNKGFSLVELIVVIAIMAIIAAVAIPVYSTYVTKAEIATNDQLVADIVYATQLACIEENVAATVTVDADGTITLACTNAAVLTQVGSIVADGDDSTTGSLVWETEAGKVTVVTKNIDANGKVS